MRWEYLFIEFTVINAVSRVNKINDMQIAEPEAQRPRRINYCNQLGAEGWEMVNMSTNIWGDKSDVRSLAVFKRPLSEK